MLPCLILDFCSVEFTDECSTAFSSVSLNGFSMASRLKYRRNSVNMWTINSYVEAKNRSDSVARNYLEFH